MILFYPHPGSSVPWQVSTAGTTVDCLVDERVSQPEPLNLAVMTESDALDHRNREIDCEEQRQVGSITHDREQAELWRVESMEGLQIMDESRGPEQAEMEREKWGSENVSLKPNDWYKHECEGRSLEDQKGALTGVKFDDCSCQILYQECQRNVTAGKGTTVFDGCGEFMAATKDGMPESLHCVACGCHRNFHRRVILGRDGTEIQYREKDATENAEALLRIQEIAGAIKAGAGRALSLISQDQRRFKAKDFTISEHSLLVKSCVEALGQSAKALLATADCLAYLQNSNGTLLTCAEVTHRPEQCLPALVPSEGANIMAKMECKSGSPPALYSSELSLPTPFSSSKLGWQNGAFCITPRAMSETSLNEQKRKRKRTRFTFEQLKKLNEFATRTGWTLAGVSRDEVDALCADVGIEAVTLKYWIHNTRQKSRKKQDSDTKTPPGTP